MKNKYDKALEYVRRLWEIKTDMTVTTDPHDWAKVETLVENQVRIADPEQIAIIAELVIKEKPMKAIVYHGKDWKTRGRFLCPRCKSVIYFYQGHRPQRCDCCGQKVEIGG